MKTTRPLAALALAGAALLATTEAGAFCGFFAGGAGARLFNHATQVVLMREGVRTVLSMENDYHGPPAGFAMVVPVPVVLHKDQVKTLSRELFERVDQLDAPRLVEYWERDPCQKDDGYGYSFDDPLAAGGFGPNDATIRVRSAPTSVTVLNRFSAGEYQIVILGAQDSLGLEAWLHDNGYAIPSGAEPVLRPYVQSGMKFFVAKVDPSKVRFVGGRATLSPLRFHYDSDSFALPVRLGLLNSPGTQDLIVHILARNQRYEVANYDNATIPTNLDVGPAAREQFGSFYSALFERSRAARPRAVFTEYAWDAGTCDPCPIPALDFEDLKALGGEAFPPGASSAMGNSSSFVLTRLHARYASDTLGADLVFRAAPPIAGGRETRDDIGILEQGAHSDASNNFQGRYAIRHAWTGKVDCPNPLRGVWGGRSGVISAQNAAFAAPAYGGITSFVDQLPAEPGSLGRTDPGGEGASALPPRGGCAACQVGSGAEERLGVLAALVAALGLLRRRRAA
jgi:MYXO-CTERM domain-containing protein